MISLKRLIVYVSVALMLTAFSLSVSGQTTQEVSVTMSSSSHYWCGVVADNTCPILTTSVAVTSAGWPLRYYTFAHFAPTIPAKLNLAYLGFDLVIYFAVTVVADNVYRQLIRRKRDQSRESSATVAAHEG